MSSSTMFGPAADISMGWDGTIWAIDASGAPHLYDPVQDSWQLFGRSVDAAAYVGSALYVFRGAEVITRPENGVFSAPAPIGSLFPDVPDSFKLGLTGALQGRNGKLYFIKGGWYVPADASAPPARLSALRGWPSVWADGLIDAVIGTDGYSPLLAHGGEYVETELDGGWAESNPAPVAVHWGGCLPPGWLGSGVDAAASCLTGDGKVACIVFKDAAVAQFTLEAGQGATPSYVGSTFPKWPADWNPMLANAPSGRMGQLWGVAQAAPGRDGGHVTRHDGESWSAMTGTWANSVSATADNTVFTVNPAQKHVYWWTEAAGWAEYSAAPGQLVLVSADGNGGVWAGDSGGTVFTAPAPGQPFAANGTVGAAVSIAASQDGTLWHCRAGDSNAYCFITAAASTPSAVHAVGPNVASVDRVAAVGYGRAYALATQTDGSKGVYRYDSPYVFKSPLTAYGPGYEGEITSAPGSVILGQGLVYCSESFDSGETETASVAAFDAHSGRLVATHTFDSDQLSYTGLVFDPVHALVYAGATPYWNASAASPGRIVALDAKTLALVWVFAPAGLRGVDGVPTLAGGKLFFADRTGTIYSIDTGRAAKSRAPQSDWTWRPDLPPAANECIFYVTSPFVSRGLLHAGVWQNASGESANSFRVMSCWAGDGSGYWLSDVLCQNTEQLFVSAWLTAAPVLGLACSADQQSQVPVLYLNGWNRVIAQPLDPQLALYNPVFNLPTGSIASGLGYDDGSRAGGGLPGGTPAARIRLWFGDDQGNLWALGNDLHPADGTPRSVVAQTYVATTPVVYKDPAGGATVLFGLSWDENDNPTNYAGLYAYDPVAQTVASVPTGVTAITALSPSVTNGVIYAGGGYGGGPTGPTDLFGIRVDALPQALRAFVVDSQMQQDPDPAAGGGDLSGPDPIPPSRARYQTQLTVVDAQRNPIPHEPLKVWADQPVTLLLDGQAVPIGPGDDQYARLRTGADGSVRLAIGYAVGSGDAPGLYTPALRVWASFMDTFERIVVNPDHAFHQRVSTAHANAGDDDPDRVNLVTARSYAGATPAPLFSSDDQNAGQPANCAQAIGQMHSGVGFGGGGSDTRALFGRQIRHASGERLIRSGAAKRAGDTPPRYMAYDEPGGAGYFPVNFPAIRRVTIEQPTGLVFSKSKGQPAHTMTVKVVDHATAQAAFDALPPPSTNPPWVPPGASPRAGHHVGNIFTDFWNWLVNVADSIVVEITDIAVVIADDVMVGIHMLVNGVEQVFKAIVHIVDDIASAIGSFFKMIEKAIEDVIAALSVLFHFGEIMWTHRWLADQAASRVAEVQNAIGSTINPAVSAFFAQDEAAVMRRFDAIRAQLGDGDKIGSVHGMGATPHSMFTVGPPGGTASSHATQCSYGLHKLKSGIGSATTSTSASAAGRLGDDSLAAFFANFVASLSGDGDLAQTAAQFDADFADLFKANSVAQFFDTLLLTLVDMLETLLVAALAVAKAFIEGFLAVIEDAITMVMGLLTTEIDIPVLTWLYQLLFNEKLTFLNLATLVAAIPLTIVFRVVEGAYPSARLPPAGAAGAWRTGAAAPLVQKYLGFFAGMLAVAGGVLNAIGDIDPEAPSAVGGVAVGVGLLIQAFSFPLIDNQPDGVTEADWVVYGVYTAGSLLGACALASPAEPELVSGCMSVWGCLSVVVAIIAFVDEGKRDAATDVGFASNLTSAVPGMINPLKFIQAFDIGPIIVGGVDIVGGIVVGALDVAAVELSTEPDSF